CGLNLGAKVTPNLVIPTPKARVVGWIFAGCILWGFRRRPVDRWFTVNEVIHNDNINVSSIRYGREKRCISTGDADTSDALVLEHESDERQAIICGRNESCRERVSNRIEVLNGATLRQIHIGEHRSESV